MNSAPRTDNIAQQYVLSEKFQADMLSLLESSDTADIRFLLSTSSTVITAHSAVISVRCKRLASKVLSFLSRKEGGALPVEEILEIPVHGASRRGMSEVLRYVYAGEISIDRTILNDVCALSTLLGIPSLQDIVIRYLREDENCRDTIAVLDRELRDPGNNSAFVSKLTDYFAENCSRIIMCKELESSSLILMQHIIKQETLGACEEELWDGLVKWTNSRCHNSPHLKVSQMTSEQRRAIVEHMNTFCRPGYIRILNFDSRTFATEVEPLGVFPLSEVLLKYRFDASVGCGDLSYSFPKDRYSFLARVRHRTMVFESTSHPHARGIFYKKKVEFPMWVTELEVNIDPYTSLGRYADLEIFSDEARAHRLFSFRSYCSQSGQSVGQLETKRKAFRNDKVPTISICAKSFWFTFYAPQNVGDLGWGYKFRVSVVR